MSALLLACAHCAQSAPSSGLRQLSIVLMVLTPFLIAGGVAFQLVRMRRSSFSKAQYDASDAGLLPDRDGERL